MGCNIVKICGIKEPIMAKQAAMAGANLIGIIFHPPSPRYIHLEQAASIAKAARTAGAAPVGIFVNHTHVEMLHICNTVNLDIVQLHGETARAQHHFLPDHFKRIYVQNIIDKGKYSSDDKLTSLDPHRDFILIDHADPGKGHAINGSQFHYDLPFPWILAGGLSHTNVVKVISDLQPNGVDVSSGVESSRGNKDIVLIKKFINDVRGFEHV